MRSNKVILAVEDTLSDAVSTKILEYFDLEIVGKIGFRGNSFLEAVLKTRTAFEKLSNQPPDASQNAPYHRYIHPICLIFYFCFRAYNNFKTAS